MSLFGLRKILQVSQGLGREGRGHGDMDLGVWEPKRSYTASRSSSELTWEITRTPWYGRHWGESKMSGYLASEWAFCFFTSLQDRQATALGGFEWLQLILTRRVDINSASSMELFLNTPELISSHLFNFCDFTPFIHKSPVCLACHTGSWVGQLHMTESMQVSTSVESSSTSWLTLFVSPLGV